MIVFEGRRFQVFGNQFHKAAGPDNALMIFRTRDAVSVSKRFS